jgi:Family of unknown function (DUF5989)
MSILRTIEAIDFSFTFDRAILHSQLLERRGRDQSIPFLWCKSAYGSRCPLTVIRGGNEGKFLFERWSFMEERKKFWLLPIIICLVLLGNLIVFTSGTAVAPFIYTLF